MVRSMWLNRFCHCEIYVPVTMGACHRRHDRRGSRHRRQIRLRGRCCVPLCRQAGLDGTTLGTSRMNIWHLCASLFVMSQR